MANITEVSQWENVIRQLENGEAATGGADGLANIQAKQLANRTKWLKENYLPLTGGNMLGKIKKSSNNNDLELLGGSNYGDGAHMVLHGVKQYADDNVNAGLNGAFSLKTGISDDISCHLCGNPNGDLFWYKGASLTDLAGSAIVAKSLGINGYVKYASGLIIQWGRIEATKTNETVNFPISFTSTSCIFTTPVQSNSTSRTAWIGNESLSKFNIYQSAIGGCTWLAIGY